MTATVEDPPIELTRSPLTDIVIPIRDAASVPAATVRRLHAHLTRTFPFPFRITIAAGGSGAADPTSAAELQRDLPEVRFVHVGGDGRGAILRRVWSMSDADVVAYMDADLPVDLAGFLPLVAPLVSGHSDLATGNRPAHSSGVLARAIGFLLRVLLGVRVGDSQCAFKAGRADVVKALLPGVHDDRWFFDTELLCVAERHGMRIHEIPIDCLDDPGGSAETPQTLADMIRGVVAISRRKMRGTFGVTIPAHLGRPRPPAGMGNQVVWFAVIGVASVVTHAGLFLTFRSVMPALAANALALGITGVLNTAANRRFTFGVRGRQDALRHQMEGGLTFLLSLTGTSLGLLLAGSGLSRIAELAVLYLGDAVATVIRFVLLRYWVFGRRRTPAEAPVGER
ncbi:GtrA family protein [Pseudonocardia sp. TRM90224]|uniref:GtrA family protein n=1 Tax=Pseudonocardia sp. TRM90224 TaxID=2812678 RepID=UPI001E345EAF|nr:GtrA family protein [Pseudonocardia sp. TRM90224]